MSALTITVIITVIMSLLFLVNKFPFGLVTLSCCVALAATGVLSISEAFSGFSNQTIILVSCMFCLSAGLQRTNLAFALKGLLGSMGGKQDLALVAVLFAIYWLMLLAMPGIVAMAIIITFLDALPETGEVTPSRVIMPLLMFNVVWEGVVPIGMGATIDFTTNAYMESIVAEDQLLTFLNTFSVRIVPGLIMIPICLFIWRLFPKKQLNLDNVEAKKIDKSDLPAWKQYLIYGCFILVILVMIFNSYFGSLMYVMPAICVAVLGFTKTLTPHEMITSLFSDTVLMLAGIMGVTAALTASGAADLIGNLLLQLVSWTDSSFMVLWITTLFTAVMTTFLSNSGVKSVLTPLVASMAVAGGMNVAGLAICVTAGSALSFCFPTGSTTCALAYASGEYNPFKILHITIPLLLVMTLVIAFMANLLFPVW
ncbi:MAG: anion permease [Lachnospiraceae bacterium]|nr:anion permease [Lachnospiraceae bacterium]